jgi:uncharacterized protein DUF3379
MNCLDFRRLVLVDPRTLGEEARAHAAECVACRDVLERQRESDDRLFAAMQVPVPDGLADRILVGTVRPERVEGRRKDWRWAIAATLVLAAGLGIVGRGYFAKDPLGLEAIGHVAGEPQSFTTVEAVDSSFLSAALADQGLKAVVALGQVTYSRICPMNGRTARHIVVRTAEGPVTLFLMIDDPDKRRRHMTEEAGMAAVTMPAARGTLAIVASSAAQAHAVEQAIRRI